MKKHQRQILKQVRELGHQIEIEYPNKGHPKLVVTTSDGRRGKFSVSCTPKQNQQAVKHAVMQIQKWVKSGSPNIRR